ncbi:tRNA/rRNA methyltransferase [Macleaya cordata]|uniref:tRNA (guanosine(18)-2'-O)-methyltransferase TARBP1 n=1 Tax=Macleaya cordata TaxID=56857 RepID=A0A200QWZ7_MACCD|nr:tRNA/rRNA methyltransferase [Macleaya cordata]
MMSAPPPPPLPPSPLPEDQEEKETSDFKTNSISIASSLTNSFRLVPPAAVPAILDSILTTTTTSSTTSISSSSTLFDSLLDAFSHLITKGIFEEIGGEDSVQSIYITSFTTALCYLLKKSGTNPNALQSFIWRGFLPAMEIIPANYHELLNLITELICDVVIESNTWAVIESTLVPFSLRSIGLSIGMLENEELAVYQWSRPSTLQGPKAKLSHLEVYSEQMPALSVALPVHIPCHVLTSLLTASLRCDQAKPSTSEPMVVNGGCAERFARNLHSNLCDMAVQLLSQSPENRSCAIRLLLPFIFMGFASDYSFQISIHGQTPVLSGKYFFAKLWNCCREMFSLGPLGRKDAYNVLSLYLSHSRTKGCEDDALVDRIAEFDIRAEKEFWDEIKQGLVDKEGSVRKQSLHILKIALRQSEGRQCYTSVSETTLHEQSSNARGITKRGQWAEKEAKSMGVGQICKPDDPCLNGHQRWEAFVLLYEMLEEYGTHLVEAAWNHQISLLLHFSRDLDSSTNPISEVYQNQLETLEGTFSWLAVLWERGLCHENPQVRCLIMQSFLGIDWTSHGNCAKEVPESFVLGPFLQGLNDPVHHKDFGCKGVYTSKTIESAANFLHHFCSYFSGREHIAFLCSLASIVKQESFGRAGLMAFSVCIASAACGRETHSKAGSHDMVLLESAEESSFDDNKAYLLDILRLVIESSKQHFNPNYRLRVCNKVLEAASSVMCTSDVPIETLMHFFSKVPREFTDCGGSLRGKVKEWFFRCKKKDWHSNLPSTKMHVLESLCHFPKKFIHYHHSPEGFVAYDDEDLDAWAFEAQRWARLLFLVITEEHHLKSLFKFLQDYGINIFKQNNHLEWVPPKFLILALSLIQELSIIQEKSSYCAVKIRNDMEVGMPENSDLFSSREASIVFEKFNGHFRLILEELLLFAKSACSIFWASPVIKDDLLPCSVTGKLGGPSPRRLSSSTTTAVLNAILSMRTIASISLWCTQLKNDSLLDSTFAFLWSFSWQVILSPTFDTEAGAEVRLAAYEALAPVLKTLSSATFPMGLDLILANDQVLPEGEGKPLLDYFVLCFLQNINDLLAIGVLTRSRRAILMNWKWLCLVSLLSIPYCVIENGVHSGGTTAFFSGAAIKSIFVDLVESLENAGESSVLPILRSVRLVLGLFTSGRMGSAVSLYDILDTEMMSKLMHSSWIFHVNCNKRRVAHIAALLSSVLHSSVFSDESMHETTDSIQGPMKLFVEQILEEGTKSPRTIRLSALHLTGLWFLNPKMIKYYIKELKLLSLYGSVAFDEDFEAELAESNDARMEVSLLAKSPDSELTEAFINTELYARVSVAVLFYKLADMADRLGSTMENEDCHAALQSGKLFLLELLDSVVNDKDLTKELYKKYSGIHRRKVRAWQMICILSRFVREDIVQQVTSILHLCLYRNNLPSVRQYLETFAIQIYLKFPSLVADQLGPIFRDYNMRPQALASYVFIATNVILHTTEELVRFRHLNQLLPPIIPLLTSHHHSLRGFTQLLVYQVLFKLIPPLDSNAPEIVPLEKKCFGDLKLYLAENSDCVRLRESMEGFLDAFDPIRSSAPSGVFTARGKELEFECVPTSLLEKVITFLNDVREELRCSMAKDAATIKNESLATGESCNGMLVSRDVSLDFQKKITLSQHERLDYHGDTFLEMEKEDELLNQVLQSRIADSERMKASRQQCIVVASLLDRIPNLAGLARTCEVFKTAGLAVADASVVNDKQFQLISVTAEKWVPIIEVPVSSLKVFLEKKKREGFSILGLEQTANSIPLDQYTFPKKMVLVLGREKEGIPVDIIHVLDGCVEIPQLGVVRSLNVHVSGAIALWEYTRQQRTQLSSSSSSWSTYYSV